MNGCCCIANFNLCIEQSATYQKVFTWSAGACCNAAGSAPQPVDLTGYSASMQIKPYALSSTILYDAGSNIVLGGIYGTISLLIPAAATAAFTWWQGVYDMLLTDPYGVVTRLLSGSVSVCPGVTGVPAGGGGNLLLLPGSVPLLLPGGSGIIAP